MTHDPEDEAFSELERTIRDRAISEYLAKAHKASRSFVSDTPATQLAALTLTQAYEIGYRHGYTDGKAS